MLLLRLLSHFSHVQLCSTPETEAHQAPLSLGFSRQEYWSGVPFPSPMKVKLLSHVQLFATPWTVAYQSPPSMGFSRQEHWSRLPLSSPSRNATHYILTVYNNDRAKSLIILKYRTPPPPNHFIILESK